MAHSADFRSGIDMDWKVFFIFAMLCFSFAAALPYSRGVMCGNTRCRQGQRCVEQVVNCIRAPCPPLRYCE